MRVPKAIKNLAEAFERLPGIGPKTAQRLTYYLLRAPDSAARQLAKALEVLHTETKVCSQCHNVADNDPCAICTSSERDRSIFCVVEEPLDVLAMERVGEYRGLYHVLGGVISPLNNIGPEELFIEELITRLKKDTVEEVILATNPSMEGEATAMYLTRIIKPLGIKVTRIGQGLPTGGALEYADDRTLREALNGRREY